MAGFLLGTWANVRWQVGPEDADVYWVAADVGWLTFPIQAIVGGLANGITVACFEGAMDTPSNARFYEICEKHHVTKVLGAPTLLRMLRKYGDELAAGHPLPDLKLVTVQGEPLDGETFAWATRHLGGGVPVVNAYGQTETGSTWAYSVAGVEALKPGSTGTAVPGHMYDILDDDGKPVPAGTRGNLVLTQPFPTLARTVWDDPQRYQQAYFSRFPGCYCTNDEAALDPDGHLWVLGRADDVINVAAHRISTLEIEAIATGHPQVAEAAVVGVTDPTKGTVPVAFLTLLDGADPGQVRQEVSRRSVLAAGRLRPPGRGLPHLRAAEDPNRQDHAAAAAECRRARRPAGRHQRHGGSGRAAGRAAGRRRRSSPQRVMAASGLWFEQLDAGPAGRARDDAHRHRDRQRAVHDDDDEPAAAAPGRGVRGRPPNSAGRWSTACSRWAWSSGWPCPS